MLGFPTQIVGDPHKSGESPALQQQNEEWRREVAAIRLEAREEASICDGQFDKGGGGDAGAAVGGLVDHCAVGPLRGGDVVYFTAQLGDVQAVLRVGFIQADQVRHHVGGFTGTL